MRYCIYQPTHPPTYPLPIGLSTRRYVLELQAPGVVVHVALCFVALVGASFGCHRGFYLRITSVNEDDLCPDGHLATGARSRGWSGGWVGDFLPSEVLEIEEVEIVIPLRLSKSLGEEGGWVGGWVG